jgi:hypothetical protein
VPVLPGSGLHRRLGRRGACSGVRRPRGEGPWCGGRVMGGHPPLDRVLSLNNERSSRDGSSIGRYFWQSGQTERYSGVPDPGGPRSDPEAPDRNMIRWLRNALGERNMLAECLRNKPFLPEQQQPPLGITSHHPRLATRTRQRLRTVFAQPGKGLQCTSRGGGGGQQAT